MDKDISIGDSERGTDTMQAPKPCQRRKASKLDKGERQRYSEDFWKAPQRLKPHHRVANG
jgi:hypothetical protein